MTREDDTTRGGRAWSEADNARFLAAYERHKARQRRYRDAVSDDDFDVEACVVQLLNAGDADTHARLRACDDSALSHLDDESLSIISALISTAVGAIINRQRVPEVLDAARQLLGISTDVQRINRARAEVREALAHVKRWGDEQTVAPLLVFKLGACAQEFRTLDVDKTAELLSEVAASRTSTGNQGAGLKRERDALAVLMAEAGAFAAESKEVALRKIDSADQSYRDAQKRLHRARTNLRTIEGGDAKNDES